MGSTLFFYFFFAYNFTLASHPTMEGRSTAGIPHRPLFKLARERRGKVVASMSRRPPADTFDSLYSQPGPSPANVPLNSTYPAVSTRKFGSPHPNFMAYNSPFQMPAPQQSFTGVSALVDFRDGIQIVEEDADLDRDVSSDFLQRNGRRGISSKGIIGNYHDDNDEHEEAEEESVSATAEDVRSMVEENLRRNCKSRYSSLSALAGKSGESSLKLPERKLDAKAPENSHEDILNNVRESLKEIRMKLSGETPGSFKEGVSGKSSLGSSLATPASATTRSSRLLMGSMGSMIRA